MKKKLLLLAVFASTVAIPLQSSFATNGDDLIGVTPNSEAMGGIGVGMPVGSVDSIFRNPAWMDTAKDTKVQFGGMLFMPSVKGEVNPGASADSNANLFLVPEIGIIHRINNKLVFGIGAFGVSGMGTDYSGKGIQSNNSAPLGNMRTTLQFMRIIPALSYQINPMISIGAGIDFA
ncbi:OmpP1/FadL family transporter [Hydrogenobaculum sp.]